MPSESAYDGLGGAALAARLGVPRVDVHASLGSTQDAAHALGAAGAPAGTLVLAERQEAGRGRNARAWASAAGAGIWMTLLERPAGAEALGVLSLRLALRLAPVLERWTAAPVGVKWPNDLFADGRKLAGILVEARWRGARPDWVAIGVGINVREPAEVPAAALVPGTSRVAVLEQAVPAMRAAAAAQGPLGAAELADWEARDLAAGRRCREPVAGTVHGVSADGALIIHGDAGPVAVRAGSLVLEAWP